jgi:rubrerythrin
MIKIYYSETAKEAGEDELAFWLWQIAHDEQSHASWIKHWMARNSIY